jgi:hypothetical protein
MKYLKCVFAEPLPAHLHMTFAFFGKEIVSKEMISTELKGLKPFKVFHKGKENFGSGGKDLWVEVYTTAGTEVHEARMAILLRAGEQVIRDNRINWNPHLTLGGNLDAKVPETMEVIGIESNNGGFRVMF